MAEQIVRASHKGLLPIADLEIPCYVLEDGTRLISQRGMQKAVGISTSGGTTGAHRLAKIAGRLEAKGAELKALTLRMPLEALSSRIYQPRLFLPPTGGLVAYGQEATTLIDLCELILKCRDAGLLASESQEKMAVAADVIIRAFAKVGIIAVIDEVTGYQEVRDREELQKILAAYISPTLMPYTSRFPTSFFEEMFRLRGWPFRRLSSGKGSPRGPRYAGKLIVELIYKQLPPGVLEELRQKNPTNEKYQRGEKNYRFLTEDIGDPHLTKQVAIVGTLFKISPNWRTFERHFERAFPKHNQQQRLFEDDDEPDE